MPIQLRTQTMRPQTAHPHSTPPKLLPLAVSGKRPIRPFHRRHRRSTLLCFATAISIYAAFRCSTNLPDLFPPISHETMPQILEGPDSNTRPRPVLIAPTSGGIGNQIYFILEALYLARLANLDLVMPTIPSRTFTVNNIPVHKPTEETSGGNFYDLQKLSLALQTPAKIVPALPGRCKSRFDAAYITMRSPPARGYVVRLSPRAREAACFLTGQANNETGCILTAFAGTPILRRPLPLSRPQDMHFVDELSALHGTSVLPTGRADKGRGACVVVDGHSFNIAGQEGHEYLYSFMHYLEHSRKIREEAKKWAAKDIAVFHLRYDENECVVSPSVEEKICIRVQLASRRKGTVYWAGVSELVTGIVKAMDIEGVRTVYLAASPYVPGKILDKLRKALGEKVKVAARVDSRLDHNEQNFVERELAIRAKCFIGDFASTWSGTVYYKRRTLGMKTFWSSVLLGKNGSLGYYIAEAAIPEPEVFERNFALGS